MQSRAPPRPKPSNWTPQSPLTVFVRNLQLLQLDQHDDWPAITVRALSPSSQNQRQRIKAIEWALYHLVTIWDPETARDKLRPFFPSLEPLQSVNLRAALFRVLSELKKNGDLGRETIVRKSMLDDCKGEKFDELLAVFSTAVLRKALADSMDDGAQIPAVRMSMAQGLTRQEYQRLLPLILAHRGSLSMLGERRDRVRSTHEKFSELLDYKKSQLDSRSNESRPVIDNRAEHDSMARDIKANWLGSEEWADTLLYGGSRSSNDAFLELPFDAAWSKANELTVEDLSTGSTPDLLVDLETRVSRQRARLHRWRQYRSTMQKHEGAESTRQMAGPPLAFRDHQPLTVASISKAVRQPVERVSPKAEDRALLFSMSEALARINGTSHTSGRTAPWRTPSTEADPRNPPRQSTEQPSKTPSPPLPSQEQVDSMDTSETTPNPTVHILPEPEPEPKPQPDPEKTHRLVERTRKSMSLLPPIPHNPPSRRESLRPRRTRKSYAVNQFETPETQATHTRGYEISRASTPHDDLFEEDAEYASVFKSRPRVAHSPIASPAVHVSPVDEFDLGGDGDEGSDLDMDEEYEAAMAGSPSAGRRWR